MATTLPPFAINAPHLGPDLFAVSPSRLLWEPNAALLPSVPSSFSFGNPAAASHFLEFGSGDGGGIGKSRGFFCSSPDEQAVIRKEALQWTIDNKRPLGEGAYVKVLASHIQAELKKIVSSEDVTPLARQIALHQPVYVRIAPTDGSLENYSIEISASRPPDINYRQIQWRLDLKTGLLEPLELKSHAVYLVRAASQAPEAPQGFIPFYRSIRFTSRTLRAEPLLLALPEAHRRRLLNEPAPVAPQGPGLMTRLRGLFESVGGKQPALVAENKSVLVRYIAKIRNGVSQEVEDYLAANESLTENGRRFIRRLSNDLLSELYRREAADPTYCRWVCLWVWLRRNDTEDYGRFELLTPDQMIDNPPRENDLLFMLVRDDETMKADMTGLVHVYNRSHMVGTVQRPLGADLAFEAFLGLGVMDKFALKLDHLHRSPRNLAEWDRWMVENRHWRKR